MKHAFVTFGANLFALAFFVIGAYTFLTVLPMNVSYQDIWMLEGVALPFALMIVAYVLAILFSNDLRRDAVLTAIVTALMFTIPAVKYAHVYASTIDASVHFSLMRSLAETGLPERNYYEYTPGLHILVASFAQLTGLEPSLWARTLPGLLGGVIPLSAYMLTHRLGFTYVLAKTIVVLSALSLPLMFIPQGTSYATVIIAPLLVFIILSVVSRNRPVERAVFTTLAVLLVVALTMWHSISSLLVPLVLGASGMVTLLLSLFLTRKQWEVQWVRSISLSFIIFGVLGTALTLLYWYVYANVLWEHFLNHIELLLSVIARERESGGVLVPERAATLGIFDLGLVFAFYHARDAIMLLFAGIAIAATVVQFWTRKSIDRPIELTYLFTSIYLIFFAIITGAFAARFATFGYHRVLIYVLIVSPVLSGYGLWLLVRKINQHIPFLPQNLILAGFVLVAFAVSAFQFYPYQPLFPRYQAGQTDGTTPLHWYHQVNTDYQRYVVEFAYTRLPGDLYLYTDYIKYQQTRLFIGPDARERFHYGPWGYLPQSYVLLHYPGEAGSYAEQAEYRSIEAITSLRELDTTSVIYDNGEAFILFVPQDLMPLYTLGGNR